MPNMVYVDLEVVRGDTHTLSYRVKDEAGDPIDLSSRSYLLQVRRWPDDFTVAGEYSVDMAGASGGLIVFTLPASVTGGLVPGPFRWDLEEVEGGVTRTPVGGAWKLAPDVSRAV